MYIYIYIYTYKASHIAILPGSPFMMVLQIAKACKEKIRTALGDNKGEDVNCLINDAMKTKDSLIPAFHEDIARAAQFAKERKPPKASGTKASETPEPK